eukprot:scaffold37_cov346-Pavlova_lutheri.AAC.13
MFENGSMSLVTLMATPWYVIQRRTRMPSAATFWPSTQTPVSPSILSPWSPNFPSVQDRIEHQLSWSVVGHLSSSFRAEHGVWWFSDLEQQTGSCCSKIAASGSLVPFSAACMRSSTNAFCSSQPTAYGTTSACRSISRHLLSRDTAPGVTERLPSEELRRRSVARDGRSILRPDAMVRRWKRGSQHRKCEGEFEANETKANAGRVVHVQQKSRHLINCQDGGETGKRPPARRYCGGVRNMKRKRFDRRSKPCLQAVRESAHVPDPVQER